MTDVEIVTHDAKGKPAIKKKEAFAKYAPEFSFDLTCSFEALLDTIDGNIKANHPGIAQGAFNNCHGDWYEWLLAIAAWNRRIETGSKLAVYLLPNVKRFQVSDLYIPKISQYITDLKAKTVETAGVELITSNPDFVIIDTTDIDLPDYFAEPIQQVSIETLDMLEQAYEHYIGKCSFSGLYGYISVKNSLRPDRRLQIAHEGSLMKALYVHIQTREWIIAPNGLKYYAISQKATSADLRALKTVATHSITSVESIPQSAVDEAYQVSTIAEAVTAFNEILNPSA
ncbi:Cfr10I/Bse634I family restriction endonuclease [Terasakiella sp.]|uniref:Cfr10I/Bse634I family restriction endonuclease n=1 Tax=Terasakiella sp. TaxID=2034861 RepID=UPI003AA98BD5